MFNSLFVFVACETSCINGISFPVSVDGAYIAKFYNNVPYAVSLIFDDDELSHADKVLPILEKNQMVATFNINPGGQFASVYLNGYKKLFEYGCEIGSHGWYHIDLTTLPPGDVKQHMVTQPINLITKYFGQCPISFSLPNSHGNDQIRELFVENYYVSKHYSLTDITRDALAVTKDTQYSDFVDAINQSRSNKRWLMIALHGIDGSGWVGGSITSDLLDRVCAYLKKSNTYVSTTGDLGLYEYLYANATLIVNKISNGYIEIIPKLPDSLRYPDGWRKEITVVIPIGNISEVINFDFKKDTKIIISANGIYVQ